MALIDKLKTTMQLCVKCFFDNKPEFDRAQDYLESIVGGNICVSGRDIELEDDGKHYIETYMDLTQDQLNGLLELCPIRPPRQRSKQRVISKIAFGIGQYGMSYHPDDHLDDETWEDADILGLDVYDLTANLMEEFGIFNNKTK